MVKVVHVEEGDGPTAWSIVAYSNGVLELEKFGRKRICRRVQERKLQELWRLVEGSEFAEVSEFEGFLGHQEWMQVIHQGTVRQFVAKELPVEIMAVFQELDRIFSSEFPRRYTWPLIEDVPSKEKVGERNHPPFPAGR